MSNMDWESEVDRFMSQPPTNSTYQPVQPRPEEAQAKQKVVLKRIPVLSDIFVHNGTSAKAIDWFAGGGTEAIANFFIIILVLRGLAWVLPLISGWLVAALWHVGGLLIVALVLRGISTDQIEDGEETEETIRETTAVDNRGEERMDEWCDAV